MDTQSVATPESTPRHGDFTAETHDHLTRASAMAAIITGEGFECFDRWNDSIKSNYLWALASEIEHALRAYEAELTEAERRREGGAR